MSKVKKENNKINDIVSLRPTEFVSTAHNSIILSDTVARLNKFNDIFKVAIPQTSQPLIDYATRVNSIVSDLSKQTALIPILRTQDLIAENLQATSLLSKSFVTNESLDSTLRTIADVSSVYSQPFNEVQKLLDSASLRFDPATLFHKINEPTIDFNQLMKGSLIDLRTTNNRFEDLYSNTVFQTKLDDILINPTTKKYSINLDTVETISNNGFRTVTETSLEIILSKSINKLEAKYVAENLELKKTINGLENKVDELLNLIKQNNSPLAEIEAIRVEHISTTLFINFTGSTIPKKVVFQGYDNQFELSRILFKNKTAIRKDWDAEDIVKLMPDYKLKGYNNRTVLDLAIKVNEKFERQAGLKDFIKHPKDRIYINPDYIKHIK